MPEKGHCIEEQEVKCLFFVDTWCIHQITCQKWVVESLHLCRLQKSISRSPSPVLQVTAAGLLRWDPEFSREQTGHHWGRIHPFILLLSFVISARMVGSWALNYPEGLCFHLFAWLSVRNKKEFFPTKVSCVLGLWAFLFCFFVFFVFVCLISSAIQQDFVPTMKWHDVWNLL